MLNDIAAQSHSHAQSVGAPANEAVSSFQTLVFVRQLFGVILVVAIAATSAAALNATLVALIVFALCGPAQAVRAAALAVALKYLNPVFVAYDSVGALLFWVLLIAIALRGLPSIRANHLKLLIPVWAFSLLAAVLSLFSSPAVTISLMKIVTFACVVPAILAAFLALPAAVLPLTKQWFAAYTLAIIGLSAVVLPFPSIAYARVPGSLQGIFSHPQTLGVVAAPASAWLIAGLIAMRGRARPGYVVLMVVATTVMLLTLARTAAVAAVAGTLIACLFPLIARIRESAQAGAGRIVAVILVGIFAIVLVDVLTGRVAEAVQQFVLKREAHDAAASFYQSRGANIVSQWQNFAANPLVGTGFGVFANGEFPAGIVEVYGIPVSAPVEKGFLPTAILEETGIFGALLFVMILVNLAREAHKNVDVSWIAAFWATVMVNVGEAVILAPGGIGLFVWLVLGVCVASGRRDATSSPTAHHVVPPASSMARFPNLMS